MKVSLMQIETFYKVFPTEDLIMFVESIRYLIIKSGGMATKSLVEDVLIDRFGCLDRSNAHSLTNMAEATNKRFFTIGPTRWTSKQWPEPQVEDWPYLERGAKRCDQA